MAVNKQTLMLRTKQIIDNAPGEITTRQAMAEAIREMGPEAAIEYAVSGNLEAFRRASQHRPVYEQDALYDITEPFAINDGDNGQLWVRPEDATCGQVEQENDEQLAYLTGQVKLRQRHAVDIVKVIDAVDGDRSTPWKAARRAIEQ